MAASRTTSAGGARPGPPAVLVNTAAGYALWGTLVWVSVRAGTWQALLADAPATSEPAAEIVRAPWQPTPRGGQAKP